MWKALVALCALIVILQVSKAHDFVPLSTPQNGTRSCTTGVFIAYKCSYTCDKGFFMRAPDGSVTLKNLMTATCSWDPIWNNDTPTCEPITCLPAQRDPAGGTVSCTNENFYESVCTFACGFGFELVGRPISKCQKSGENSEFGEWSNPPPTCKVDTGTSAPQNGKRSCINEVVQVSKCSYICDKGYFMRAPNGTVMRQNLMTATCTWDPIWTSDVPTCEPITCVPPQLNPEFGSVNCSRDNRYGSVCSFRCIQGYDLIGQPRSECLDSSPGDPFGDWSDPTPSCELSACSPALVTPTHGSMRCSNETSFGSVCSFSCIEGYYMLSESDDAISSHKYESLCSADGTWSNPEPTCELIFCLPEQTAPRHGDVSCTDSNNYLSLCTFTCNPGYRPSKPKTTTQCLDDGSDDARGYWSDQMPSCVLTRSCSPAQRSPVNGEVSCTDGSNLGSICTFRCNKGFYQTTPSGDIVRSNDWKTECLSSNDWSRLPSRCLPIRCMPPHIAPFDGRVSCSNGNLYRSICSFGCDPGYEVAGRPKSSCNDDGNGDEFGEWSSPPPICSPIACNPPLRPPFNGEVSCSDSNVFGSLCNFICNDGYYMTSGSRPILSNILESECGPERRWTKPTPSCRPIKCVPPHRRPANGALTCSNGNNYESICWFTCDQGYKMKADRGGQDPVDNELFSTCGEDRIPGDDKGAWSDPPPSCEPDTCVRLSAPRNGSLSCSNGVVLASKCSYICDTGYFMRGPDGNVTPRNLLTTICTVDLVWSSDSPICEPITCLPVQVDPVGGTVSCTNENFYQSMCTYTCGFRWQLVGPPRMVCQEIGENSEFGRWSNPPSICKENLCDESLLLSPVNGIKACSNGNVLGSVCTFLCDRFHTRKGPARSTCIDFPQGPRWSHTAPTCEPDLCQPSQESLRHGEVSCTKNNFVNSVCTFICTDPGYSLFPPGIEINRCLTSKKWSQLAPCCERPCPPYAKMDAFIVLDSSSSVGATNWGIMKGFIRSILASFTVSPDATHFAIIRYNRNVDSVNQIKLNNFTNDKDGLLAAFDSIPYDGSGTRTGRAIKYVNDVLMTPENGDRPDVQNILLVITDGKSQDDVLKPSEDLRNKGVITFAIGIQPPRGKLDETQLNQIAGDSSNVLIADGFAKLDSNFGIKFTDKVCGRPCDN